MSGWDGNGNFIRDNGVNSGSNVWAQDKSAGTKILSSLHDAHDELFATGLENCVTRDGQNEPTVDLPMGGFKHTDVDEADALDQYLRASQAVYNKIIYCGTSSGAANTYTVTANIPPTANTAGMEFMFKSHQLNTASSTFNIGALSLTMKRSDGSTNLSGSEIPSGAYVRGVSDGTNFILTYVSPIWTTWSAGSSATGPMTFGTLTVDYSRYRRDIDGRIHIEISVSGTTGGSASSSLTFALPIAPTTAGTIFKAGIADGGYKLGWGLWTTGFTVNVYKYDSSNFGIGASRGFIIKDSYL